METTITWSIIAPLLIAVEIDQWMQFTPLGRNDNSSNTISNNAIYDFINSSTSSNGIYLGRIQPLGLNQ
jgi:hypothetical protein